jgi:chemotaxis protein CheD
MGEIQVSNNPSQILACLGIGSCIAVCAFDPITRVGAMAHVVLPESNGRGAGNPGKFADTAIPMLLIEMAKKGGIKYSTIFKLAGGAQMSCAPGLESAFKTGERNIQQVKEALKKEKLLVGVADLGGTKGRTVKMYIDTGKVLVKTAGQEIREL